MAACMRCCVSVGCWLALTVGALAAPRETAAPANPLQHDARLNDITFVGSEYGWAVGDRGVIWHTEDGGAHWSLQDSGVDCPLTSVCFLSEKNGWAAGGCTQPYATATSGVILRTRDGGQHWTLDRKLALPAIERIGFFDATHGWALGQTSAFFPAGVFSTSDGGRSWAALPTTRGQAWLAGDFLDPQTGAVAGRSSSLALVRRGQLEPAAADHGLRALRRMKLVAPGKGWMVGDGGLVLQTQDLGKSWQTPEGEIPGSIANQFDWMALATHGSHCWIAGSPGTRVLHSADAGRTWIVHDTGQPMPIRGMVFVDESRGWAACELGTILATADGGKTWRKERFGGSRSAYLGLFSRPTDVPLELMTRLSTGDGYLGAVEILARQDADPATAPRIDPLVAAHEASVLTGASATGSAWRFPVQSSALRLSGEQLVASWNQANDGQALERLEAHVVKCIRMWRPNVVVTNTADGSEPLARVVNQVVLRAVERAGDPRQHADQVADAGLQPWKVQKVYGALPAGQSGGTNINTSQLIERLGRSISEVAVVARGVVGAEAVEPDAKIGFRLLVDHIPQELGQRDFFSGINLSPGGDARRRYEDMGDKNVDALRREVQLRRNLQAILARSEQGGERDGRFLADIGDQTKSLEPSRAAEVVAQLAERYVRQGRWELAAECYELIADRYAQQPLAARSLAWLIKYYASSEVAWQTRSTQQLQVQQAVTVAPSVERQRAVQAEEEAGAGTVRRASAIGGQPQVGQGAALAVNLRDAESRASRASAFAKQLEAQQPAFYAEPGVRFPLAVAHRQLGQPRQAERFYAGFRLGRPHDAWWACAQTEMWLNEPKGQPPKSSINCVRAAVRPRLDGRLEERMWQAEHAAALRSPQRDDAAWESAAMLAYDDEYLYIGISCTRVAGFTYTKSDRLRPRDPDLGDQDRVELYLDLDRDFATYYRLVIDHRGWATDNCWLDKNWNPQWFIASGGDEHTWTAEAAIPWSELTGQPPSPKTAWVAGIQRIVPGTGFQSWTQPAASEVQPEGFGYLLFQ